MRALAQIPLLPRSTLIGAMICGLIGAIAGLVQGLRTYAPTAWPGSPSLNWAFSPRSPGHSSGSLAAHSPSSSDDAEGGAASVAPSSLGHREPTA